MRSPLALALVVGLVPSLVSPVLGPSLDTVLGGVAHAEDIASYETEGDADARGRDPRVAALDQAFARAVSLSLDELVAPEIRAAHKPVLDRELVGRARLWVARFSVKKDVVAGDRRQLEVTVRVDRDKVRAKLAELQIPTMTPTEASQGRAVAVLLRVTEPAGVRATFGAAAERDVPGLGALASALRTGGMAVQRAPAAGPEARPGDDLPLSDEEAEALAAQAKAELAAIAGVSVGAPVPVRGVPIDAALVTAHVRLIDGRGRNVVGDGRAQVAARGTEPSVVNDAIERALVGAASDVLPPPRQTLTHADGFTGDDIPVTEPGVVLVRLAPQTPWGFVLAEQKYLAGARGVSRAVLRRLSPGGWVIGVTTSEPVERIAQIARKPPTADARVSVKVRGGIVDVTLAEAP